MEGIKDDSTSVGGVPKRRHRGPALTNKKIIGDDNVDSGVALPPYPIESAPVEHGETLSLDNIKKTIEGVDIGSNAASLSIAINPDTSMCSHDEKATEELVTYAYEAAPLTSSEKRSATGPDSPNKKIKLSCAHSTNAITSQGDDCDVEMTEFRLSPEAIAAMRGKRFTRYPDDFVPKATTKLALIGSNCFYKSFIRNMAADRDATIEERDVAIAERDAAVEDLKEERKEHNAAIEVHFRVIAEKDEVIERQEAKLEEEQFHHEEQTATINHLMRDKYRHEAIIKEAGLAHLLKDI